MTTSPGSTSKACVCVCVCARVCVCVCVCDVCMWQFYPVCVCLVIQCYLSTHTLLPSPIPLTWHHIPGRHQPPQPTPRSKHSRLGDRLHALCLAPAAGTHAGGVCGVRAAWWEHEHGARAVADGVQEAKNPACGWVCLGRASVERPGEGVCVVCAVCAVCVVCVVCVCVLCVLKREEV
jgi:hypothetical protein